MSSNSSKNGTFPAIFGRYHRIILDTIILCMIPAHVGICHNFSNVLKMLQKIKIT
mgnify:CR=1 FL=1